jgi:hypothetical protein
LIVQEEDLNIPEEFNDAIRKFYPRAFGPLEFLCDNFNGELENQNILKKLTRENNDIEKISIHGMTVAVTGKKLRRGVQLLNHAS